MLETIFSGLLSGITNACSFFFVSCLRFLEIDIAKFGEYFPAVTVMYSVIRGIALGLAIGIALFQLLRFLGGPLAKVDETPVLTLVRVFFAIGFIYFGGYVLEIIVDLFKGPYSTILSSYGTTLDFSSGMFREISSFDPSTIGEGTGTIGNLAKILLSLVLVVAVAISIFKLVVELFERYVMVGVLVYTAPLGWCTLASASMAPVFKKWLTMIISQCLLMLLSAWSVNVMVSILTNGSPNLNIIHKCLLALAFSRVAQKFDSYLNTLGLSAAVTGGNMVAELFAAGSTAAGAAKWASKKFKKMGGPRDEFGSNGKTLGEAGVSGSIANAVGGFFAGAYHNYKSTGNSGMSFGERAKEAVKEGGTVSLGNLREMVAPGKREGRINEAAREAVNNDSRIVDVAGLKGTTEAQRATAIANEKMDALDANNRRTQERRDADTERQQAIRAAAVYQIQRANQPEMDFEKPDLSKYSPDEQNEIYAAAEKYVNTKTNDMIINDEAKDRARLETGK